MSDFPEFDKAYYEVLLPDNADRFNHLASQTHFNIYNSLIWRGTGRLFAEAIVKECIGVVEKDMDPNANWCSDKILKHFGVEK